MYLFISEDQYIIMVSLWYKYNLMLGCWLINPNSLCTGREAWREDNTLAVWPWNGCLILYSRQGLKFRLICKLLDLGFVLFRGWGVCGTPIYVYDFVCWLWGLRRAHPGMEGCLPQRRGATGSILDLWSLEILRFILLAFPFSLC